MSRNVYGLGIGLVVVVKVRWDFIGRATELAMCTAMIGGTSATGSTSVLIVGRRGSGRSTFAAEVVRRSHSVVKEAGDVVVVDDVDRLDDIATQPVLAMISAGRPVVITTSSIAASPQSVVSLVESGRIGVVTLREFSRSECVEAVEAALGGAISGRLASALWQLSHGSLSVLTAVVEGSVAAGRITKTSGTWDCPGDLELSRVGVELASRVRLLTEEQSEALYTVALSEPVPSATLNQLVSESVVDYLSAQGFVEVTTLPGFAASLFAALTPPAHGVILRESVPVGRRREITRRILALDSPGPHEPVRPMAWALDNGETVSPERAVRAAERANRLHDYHSAARICTALVSETGVGDDIIERALLHRAVALRHLTRFDDAIVDIERLRDLLVRTRSSPLSETWCDRFSSMTAAYADIVHGADLDCTPALGVIDECARLVDSDPDENARNTRRHLAALRVQHQAYAGRFVSALAEHEKLGRLPSPFRQRLDVITAVGLVAVGAGRSATTRVEEAFRQAGTVPNAPWLTEELAGSRFLTTLRSQGPSAATALATADGDTDRQAVVRWDDGVRPLAEAELRLAAGDIAGARQNARDAVSIIEVDGPRDYLARALSLCAESDAFAGNHVAAAGTAERARSTPGFANSLFAADVEISLITADVLRPTGDPHVAREAAADFIDQGLFGVAARILHLLVRLGHRLAAEELMGMAGALDGDLNNLYLEHARAVVDEDGGALLAVGTQFLHHGLVLVSAEIAEAARTLSLARSQHDMAAAAERQAAMLNGLLDFEDVVTLRSRSSTTEVPRFTRREQEIAVLVASGMSNRDMASTLGVSVRTIEGHLARMYTKLGISGRRELQDHTRSGLVGN